MCIIIVSTCRNINCFFLFFSDVGEKSIEKTAHSMLYYVKEANSMLRSMNFKKRRKSNRGGKKTHESTRCLGVHVSDIRIVTSPHSSHGFCKIICKSDFIIYVLNLHWIRLNTMLLFDLQQQLYRTFSIFR